MAPVRRAAKSRPCSAANHCRPTHRSMASPADTPRRGQSAKTMQCSYSKIIQRVDQRVQFVLGLAAFVGVPLGKADGGADGLAAGEEELLVALADGGLLRRFA